MTDRFCILVGASELMVLQTMRDPDVRYVDVIVVVHSRCRRTCGALVFVFLVCTLIFFSVSNSFFYFFFMHVGCATCQPNYGGMLPSAAASRQAPDFQVAHGELLLAGQALVAKGVAAARHEPRQCRRMALM